MERSWSIGLFTPPELPGLVALHEACFGERLDVESFVRQRYVEAEYPRTDIVVARSRPGQIVGTQAVTMFDAYLAGRPVRVGMFSMGMVHPDFRGRGLFRRLVEAAEARGYERGAAVLFTMPNDRSYPAFCKFRTWRELPCRRLCVLPIDLGGLLRDVARAGPFGKAMAWPADAVFRRHCTSCPEVFETDLVEVAEEADALAESFGRSFHGLMCARDSRFLRWRFVDSPVWRYRMFFHRDAGGKLDGYVVTTTEERFGTRVGYVVDMLARRGSAGQEATLRHVAGAMRSAGATQLASICLLPAHRRLLIRAGYVDLSRLWPRKFRTFFSQRPDGAGVPSDMSQAGRWYITLADFDTI